ncbi:MAG: TatD family hydrolase, partial [Spirochaetaceae bacterium]|nr:TatD family hydrolase [Spirochaetaceae bacterium]
GINAWFSFGTAVVLNHQTAMRAAAALPLDRLLTETDAPFQPLRFHPFSTPAGLSVIIQGIARLRREAERDGGTAMETEAAADRNFRAVFGDPA